MSEPPAEPALLSDSPPGDDEATPDEQPIPPAESADEPESPARSRTPWRDNIEAMTMAVIMALVLKQFLIEAYKIPTGSMQPTLMGLEVSTDRGSSGIFDRILVDKLSYCFRDPLRWEVVVFRYPVDRSKNFVKRVVGLPGEELRILYGDLWVRSGPEDDWKIQRRPYAVQREMWRRLDLLEPAESSWLQVGDHDNPWTLEGRAILARGDGEARFGESGPVRDYYQHGYDDAILPLVPRKRGENFVGDLRIDSEVTALPGCTAVELVLHEDRMEYRFTLPGPAAQEGAAPAIEVRTAVARAGDAPPLVLRGEPWRLPAGRAVRIAAQNLDDLLELFVEGEPLLAQEIERAARPAAAALVRVRGEGADLRELMVHRDVYYTTDRKQVTETPIPEGHYFVLGDNTQDSADSREWSFFRRRVPDGQGGTRILRGSVYDAEDRRNPSPPMSTPEGELVVWMVDEWGERWRFPVHEVDTISSVEAPFVPRDLIRGRALAVFWPVIPWRGISRLRWIH